MGNGNHGSSFDELRLQLTEIRALLERTAAAVERAAPGDQCGNESTRTVAATDVPLPSAATAKEALR